jgi:hypothetical protein
MLYLLIVDSSRQCRKSRTFFFRLHEETAETGKNRTFLQFLVAAADVCRPESASFALDAGPRGRKSMTQIKNEKR